MDEFEKGQFWEALGRLYTETESLKTAIGHLFSATENLKTVSENLVRTAESHERKLDRVEVVNVAILEDLRSAKEAIQRIERKLDARDNN